MVMIPKNNREALRSLLIKHEGYRKYPYVCSAGKLTIGIGHNLTDNGLPDYMINKLFEYDVGWAVRGLLGVFSNFATFSGARQIALIDMVFQLGLPSFKGFKNTIQFIRTGEWALAADEALDSRWARNDTPERAKEITDMLRSG